VGTISHFAPQAEHVSRVKSPADSRDDHTNRSAACFVLNLCVLIRFAASPPGIVVCLPEAFAFVKH
jgi:hypothetical protein